MRSIGDLRRVSFPGKGNLYENLRFVDIAIRHFNTQIDVVAAPPSGAHQDIAFVTKVFIQ